MAIPIPEKRITDFEDLAFGMFIHWGLYSRLGQGEWAMNFHKIPKEEYSSLAKTFTASGFDAEKIVSLAKSAGMKYITLTTRHHDGFSLYDTCGLSEYDAVHTPAGRDLIKEFVDACNKGGIVPMFYHTTLDWYQDSFENDFEKYLQYLRDSVEILCTNYGKIGGLWFDGNWSKQGDVWQEDKLYGVIRKHQPDAIIVNNTGLGKRGELGNIELDSVTFEQGHPTPLDREGMPKYVAAEMCHTLNDHWGWAEDDFNYKSPASIIESLCHCRKVGANYLLNIGPMADGSISPIQEEIIRNTGKWVSKCGQSIYKGRPCNIVGVDKNFALNADGKIYLYVYKLGTKGDSNVVMGNFNGNTVFKNVQDKVKSIKWVDNGEKLDFRQDGNELYINCTPCDYGKSYVVRVAELEIE